MSPECTPMISPFFVGPCGDPVELSRRMYFYAMWLLTVYAALARNPYRTIPWTQIAIPNTRRPFPELGQIVMRRLDGTANAERVSKWAHNVRRSKLTVWLIDGNLQSFIRDIFCIKP